MAFPLFKFTFTFEFIGVFCILFYFFPLYSSSHNISALYIFGDSTVDAGNNYQLKNAQQAGYAFGIDSKNHKPIGRFTNGKTIADFLALKLGLPLIPALYNISEDQRKHTTTGLNYGSGGCGILPETNAIRECLYLDKQIHLFNETVTNFSVNAIMNREELDLHLSNSLFLISIGTNDYFTTTDYLDRPDFHNFLLEQLSLRLKKLVDLGAKKFLVNNLGHLGCAPMYTFSSGGACKTELDKSVKMFADGLPKTLHKLQEDHKGTIFSYSDNFKFFQQVKSKGVLDTTHACVVEGHVCNHTDKHFYFDTVHTSQVANSEFIDSCFDKSLCIPNVEQIINI